MYIGVGEKVTDLERFEGDRFISRLLGMGDIQGLIDLAPEDLDEEEGMVEIVEEDFGRELDKLASIHASLYVSGGFFADVESAYGGIRDYIKDEVERLVYGDSYNDDQKEAWVDGYVDFSEDFKDLSLIHI